MRDALDRLGELGITSILLEGGPHLAGAFFDAGEIDEVRLFLAPLLLGGRQARDPLEGEGVEQIADALRAMTLDCEQVADDLLICARLQGVVTVFTGLVEDLGTVASVDRTRDGARLTFESPLAGELSEGDSSPSTASA